MQGVSGVFHADKGQNVEDVGQKHHLSHKMGKISGDFDIEEELYDGDSGSKDVRGDVLSIDEVVETDFGAALSVHHHQPPSDCPSTFAALDTSTSHSFSADLNFDLPFAYPPLFTNAAIYNCTMGEFQQFGNKNSACLPSLAFESQMWEAPLAEGTIVQSFNETTAAGVEFNTNDMLTTAAVPTLPGTTQVGNRSSTISSFAPRTPPETHQSSFQDKRYPVSVPPTSSSRDLNAHSSKSRNFICGIGGCSKAYYRHAELHRHRKTHSESKQFTCRFVGCNRVGEDGFWRKDNLTQHLRKKHGVSS